MKLKKTGSITVVGRATKEMGSTVDIGFDLAERIIDFGDAAEGSRKSVSRMDTRHQPHGNFRSAKQHRTRNHQ